MNYTSTENFQTSAEKLVLCKGLFSCSTDAVNKSLKFQLLLKKQSFIFKEKFDFCCQIPSAWLVITTILTNPESASEYFRNISRKTKISYPLIRHTYVCPSGGKKCYFLRNFCVRTKWWIPYRKHLKFRVYFFI